MNKQIFNKRSPILFKHFSRKGYALFSCIGREVLIGTLSISTLTYAKADGISTRTDFASDSLSREEVKLDEVIVTGSRAPLTQLQSAKIVEVITRDDIHRAQATTINDILKLATGVDVRQALVYRRTFLSMAVRSTRLPFFLMGLTFPTLRLVTMLQTSQFRYKTSNA